MSDYDTISTAVDKTIKLANYNKNNNTLHPDDEDELKRMDEELGKKVAELQSEQQKINTFLNNLSVPRSTENIQSM